MNKAVFLDRDGVLNAETGNYVSSIEEFTILPQVAEALKIWQDKGYLLIVITNQGGIARGLYTHRDLEEMHMLLQQHLNDAGVLLHEIYYCPHHPEYTGKCLCRKPGSLWVEKAIARFRIDPARSFFIGDRERDIQAAEAAGVMGILVESNRSLLEINHLIT